MATHDAVYNHQYPGYRSVKPEIAAVVGALPRTMTRWSGCRVCRRWKGSLFNLPAGMLVECTCGTLCRPQELTPYEADTEPAAESEETP